jgi:hypothetical protein
VVEKLGKEPVYDGYQLTFQGVPPYRLSTCPTRITKFSPPADLDYLFRQKDESRDIRFRDCGQLGPRIGKTLNQPSVPQPAGAAPSSTISFNALITRHKKQRKPLECVWASKKGPDKGVLAIEKGIIVAAHLVMRFADPEMRRYQLKLWDFEYNGDYQIFQLLGNAQVVGLPEAKPV